MQEKILEILSYTLPSVITGAVAYFFFVKYVSFEENRRRFYLHQENQKQSFPLRLQAYERMVLFLERIDPNKLLLRIRPTSEDKIAYLQTLVNAIEQEYEHNLSQQIYLTNECWNVIVTAKNTILQLLRNQAAKPDNKTAQELQEAIIKEGLKESYASTTAITFIKTEVADLF
jgi:hypothetical protein